MGKVFSNLVFQDFLRCRPPELSTATLVDSKTLIQSPTCLAVMETPEKRGHHLGKKCTITLATLPTPWAWTISGLEPVQVASNHVSTPRATMKVKVSERLIANQIITQGQDWIQAANWMYLYMILRYNKHIGQLFGFGLQSLSRSSWDPPQFHKGRGGECL